MTTADAALFASIWLSVILFVAGELQKSRALQGIASIRTAWGLWAVGALLCGIHIVLAWGLRHGWSHASAIHATARQTYEVYGVNWGGGVYVNFLFLAVWSGELLWWRLNPTHYFKRPHVVTWLLRGFYLLILANAAVVFAAPSRRLAGIVLLAVLVWAWRRAWRA